MKIKAKILILIIATLVLFFFVAAYYLQTVTAKNNEVILKEDAMKIVKQIEFTFATGGENVSARTMNKNVEEMMYLSSHIISEESARVVKKQPDAAISEDRKTRIKSSLDENLEKLLYLSSHIARIDILAFHEGGSLSPFFSKVKRAIPYTELSAEEINEARSGRTVLKPEHTSDGKFIDVIAPLYYNGSIYGITEIKLSGDAPERLLTAKRQETMLMAFVVIAVIAAVLIISMDYMVNRPIQNLLSAISEVKGGNLDVSVKGKSQDEFGRLALHFNSMIETIRRSTDEKEQLLKQINRQNDELQYRIDIATEELVQRNDELSYANQSIYDIQKKLGHSRRLAAVGQLAATVAHELGTPLHSVSGHLQLLMEEPGLSDDTNRRLNIMQS
ncbi:MAG: HAMP domain-containing protein, partial [Deltaproteobacteria bacterium]|nr:HAMP domain-containing protein [Deltaproteobacteria bacterium]